MSIFADKVSSCCLLFSRNQTLELEQDERTHSNTKRIRASSAASKNNSASDNNAATASVLRLMGCVQNKYGHGGVSVGSFGSEQRRILSCIVVRIRGLYCSTCDAV